MRRLLAVLTIALAFPSAALAWGGVYNAASDQTPINIQVSDQYPVDNTLPQTWADFLGSLVHGPELAQLNVQLMPLRLVQRTCGPSALACYYPSRQTMYVSAEDVAGGPTAQSVVAHEYGHHIATNRSNAPWDAQSWGTKRWASYENICARTKSGQLHPGDEGNAYALNPGEGFAETNRVLNEQKLGLALTPWEILDPILEPDPTALSLAEQDILQPWTGNTTSTLRGSFGNGVQRTFGIGTPLDGTLVLRLTGAKGLSLSLSANGKVVGTSRAFAYTICGARSLTLKVLRAPAVKGGKAATGAFSVSVSKP